VTLSLEGDAEVVDLFEATWLLTSESFSEEAFTSRSKLRFIVDLRSDLEKLLHILDERKPGLSCIVRHNNIQHMHITSDFTHNYATD
jgi:hypothetical protein